MELQDRQIGLLVADIYEDRELWYPFYRMKEAGARTRLIGKEEGATYHGKHGIPATADAAASEVEAADLDALIIPGGYAPDHMRRDRAMVDLVRTCLAGGSVVAAICHAGWLLCSADVLRGRTATSFPSIQDDMRHAGAEWVDREVARDGNLITSRNPDDLPAFCRAIIEALTER